MENNSNTSLDFNSIKERCNIITYISLGQIISTMILKFVKIIYHGGLEKYKYTLYKSIGETILPSGTLYILYCAIMLIPIVMIGLNIFKKNNQKKLIHINMVTNIIRLLLLIFLADLFKGLEQYSYIIKFCLGYHLNIILTIASIIYSVYIKKMSSNNS